MKAWTLREPWASLVVLGEKKWETRSRPNRKLVGQNIAIHASRYPIKDHLDEDGCWEDDVFMTAFSKHDVYPAMLRLGCIIGVVDVETCQPVEEVANTLDYEQFHFGDWSSGRYCFRLAHPRTVKAVEAKGALSVWEWDTRLKPLIYSD